MGTADDFARWEEEVADVTESANNKGVVVTVLILMAGSGMLIALGITAAGIAALVVLAVILILWRSGM